MNPITLSILQLIIILALAPLAQGLVRKCKAKLQGRRGASIFLPYWTIATLLKKEMVISKSTTWVFRAVPFVVLSSAIFIILIVPLIAIGGIVSYLSNFIIFAAILALGAIFLVLGGLDSASAFGGMGSSREMTITTLVEPIIILVFTTFAVLSGSSNIDGMYVLAGKIFETPFLILSLIALFCIALAENARYPVDNPATHLELTMVHEAMVLEYSGPYLAMLEYASMIKLTLFSLLIANFISPFKILTTQSNWLDVPAVISMALVKIIIMMFFLALLESTIAKMRFFRIQLFFSIAFFLALGGLIFTVITLPL
jgi:formate hydrogenlyase subunit 4